MPTFAPGQLAQWTGGRWTAEPAAALRAFSVDTRRIQPGEVFVALRTEKRDGHEFVPAAEAAGASAAIVAEAKPGVALPQLVVADPLRAFQAIAREHRRAFPGPVIGISGSAGKTSTKDLLALLLGGVVSGVRATEASLSAALTGRVLATEGNLNNHLGVPLTLTRLDPAQHDFAVVEAGISTPGEMQPLAEMIAPDLALITLVAPAHTEELGGVEGVAREKAVLPAAVRPGGLAIFPGTVAEFDAFRALGVRTRIVERVEQIRPAECPPERTCFTVTQRDTETVVALAGDAAAPRSFTMRRVSDGMAQNAALAICAALWLGVTPEAIRARLAWWRPARLRGEIRREDGRLLYLDCYNANPASMADALAAFDAIVPADTPRLYVIGCMEELGPDAPRFHQELGRIIPMGVSDQLFVIGTHAHDVCAGVLQMGDFHRQIQMVASLDAVISFVAEWRGAIFVKGSRRYQLEKVVEVQTTFPLPC